MVSTGGGRHETIFDVRKAVLLERIDVALVEPYREGKPGGPALAMMLQGRINKTQEQARILYLINEDGAAALVSEVAALASRIGPQFRERLLDRVQALIRDGHTTPKETGEGEGGAT